MYHLIGFIKKFVILGVIVYINNSESIIIMIALIVIYAIMAIFTNWLRPYNSKIRNAIKIFYDII